MTAVLLVLVILAPMISGLLDALSRKRYFCIIGSCISLSTLGTMWLNQVSGSIRIPIVLPDLGISYGVGPLSLLLATVTAIVWLATSLFSLRYMEQADSRQARIASLRSQHVRVAKEQADSRHAQSTPRFYLLFGLAVGGATACFFSLDFLAFLLGFEIMSFAASGLVGHALNAQAHGAARLYLNLSVISGILVAVSAALLWHQAGTLTYSELRAIPLPTALLFSLGLAIKAGAYPLHFWLPEAHPVAPSPGSALLSGIIIKTGAFGILMVASVTADGERFGFGLIIVALITMSLGVCLALVQHDAKRMLAYHSVSQMGYILLGIGLWAIDRNALGLGGAVFHIINHALFKSALFLVAGSALLSAGTVELYRLGSMRKVFGLLTPLALIPALGIAGVPGFNGFISKTLLHDALLHAETSSTLLVFAEKIFVLVAFGTVCSFIKFSWYLFFADRKGTRNLPRVSLPELLGIGVLAVCIIILGLFPQPVVDKLAEVACGLQAHWPDQLDLFGRHALSSGMTVLFGGLILFFLGLRSGLFQLHLPERFSILLGATAFGSLAANAYSRLSAAVGGVRLIMLGWEAKELRELTRSLRALDYQPSHSPALRGLSVINLNFDLYVVMAVLSVLIIGYPLVIR